MPSKLFTKQIEQQRLRLEQTETELNQAEQEIKDWPEIETIILDGITSPLQELISDCQRMKPPLNESIENISAARQRSPNLALKTRFDRRIVRWQFINLSLRIGKGFYWLQREIDRLIFWIQHHWANLRWILLISLVIILGILLLIELVRIIQAVLGVLNVG